MFTSVLHDIIIIFCLLTIFYLETIPLTNGTITLLSFANIAYLVTTFLKYVLTLIIYQIHHFGFDIYNEPKLRIIYPIIENAVIFLLSFWIAIISNLIKTKFWTPCLLVVNVINCICGLPLCFIWKCFVFISLSFWWSSYIMVRIWYPIIWLKVCCISFDLYTEKYRRTEIHFIHQYKKLYYQYFCIT